MNTKKIAFLTYSLAGGGIEKKVLGLTHFLNGKGIDCGLILLRGRNDYRTHPVYGKLSGKARVLTRGVSRIPKLMVLPVFVKALLRLRQIVRSDGISILIATDPFGWFLAFLLSYLVPLEYIVDLNVSLVHDTPHYLFLMKPVLNRSKQIVCVSRGLAQDLRGRFHIPDTKIRTIYNGGWPAGKTGLLPPDMRQIKKMGALRKRGVVFISAGRLEKQKNHGLLIRSFAAVHAANPNASLVLLGQGSREEELRQLVKQLSLSGNVHFFGFTQIPELYLRRADVFVFTSRWEGFGNAVVEAMGAGLPVIATDCPYGPREIIAGDCAYGKTSQLLYGKYGVLCPLPQNPPGDRLLLAKAMSRLAQDKKLRTIYRRKSLARAAHFTGQRMGQNYLSLVRSLAD